MPSSSRYLTAASLLQRRLAENALGQAASRYCQYPARDVAAAAEFAPLLLDEERLDSNDAFMARMRYKHLCKNRIWSLLGEAGQ
jgi:hypothetical protein